MAHRPIWLNWLSSCWRDACYGQLVMRRVFGIICLGVVSCANPSIDGVPEDPGVQPPPLPQPPGVHPSPTVVDTSEAPMNPGGQVPADAGAGADSDDLTAPSTTAPVTTTVPTPPTTSAGSANESDVPTVSDTEPLHPSDAGLEPADAGDAGDNSHSEPSSSETIPAFEAGVGDVDAR